MIEYVCACLCVVSCAALKMLGLDGVGLSQGNNQSTRKRNENASVNGKGSIRKKTKVEMHHLSMRHNIYIYIYIYMYSNILVCPCLLQVPYKACMHTCVIFQEVSGLILVIWDQEPGTEP